MAELYLPKDTWILSSVPLFLLHLLQLDDGVDINWKNGKTSLSAKTTAGADKPGEETSSTRHNINSNDLQKRQPLASELLLNPIRDNGEKLISHDSGQLCQAPFLVKKIANGLPRVIHAGVCTVARQLVILASEKHPTKNCKSLLYEANCIDWHGFQILQANPHDMFLSVAKGFKETCLKTHAEASRWTRFCEVDLSNDILDYQRRLTSLSDNNLELPHTVQQLEIELTTPKRLPNSSKYFGPGRKKWEEKLRQQAFNKILSLNCDVPSLKRKRDITPPKSGPEVRDCRPSAEMSKEQNGQGISNGLSPYLCDFQLTLVDIIVFVHMYQFLSMLLKMENSTRLLAQCPRLLHWFKKLQERVDFKQAMKKFPLDELKIEDHHIAPTALDFKGSDSIASEPVSKQEGKQRSRGSYSVNESKLKRVLTKLEGNSELMIFPDKKWNPRELNWSEIPDSVDPAEGDLNPGRAERKRHQIVNILTAVEKFAKEGDVIVDFCAGGGHVGIVLAFHLPRCQVILVENKEDSIARAIKRIQKLELSNISICQSNIDYFTGAFDIGVALHACGVATDLVIQLCLRQRASFVVCPCCYGSIKSIDDIKFPRSRRFLSDGIAEEDYLTLAHGADMVTWDYFSEKSQIGKQCMTLIDNDRSAFMMDNEYEASFYVMKPENCTPKNHLVIGTPINR